MNEVKNERQLISVKKIIFLTVIIGVILMGIAFLTGVFTVGVDGEDSRFGPDTEEIQEQNSPE